MNLEDWYGETERPWERDLKRKLRNRAILEMLEALVLVVAGIAILLFFVYATPPQWSAINDLEVNPSAQEAEAGK